MKILIVDDDRDARRFLKLIAERGAHEVIEAGNGREALNMAEKNLPDLIISDALMPVMDGFYLLREVKKNSALKHTPYIFYSAAYTGQSDIKLATAMGADGYIVKPKEPEELWAEIGRTLERSKKEKTARAEFASPDEEKEWLRQHTQVMALKLEETVIKLEKVVQEHKRDEALLLEKTSALDIFLSITPDLLCALDHSTGFKMANTAWEGFLGYSVPELMASKLLDLVHPDDIPGTREVLAKLPADRKAVDFMSRCRHKSGAYQSFKWRAAASGNLIYAAAKESHRS